MTLPAMPVGIAIEMDPDTRVLADDLLFGGSPARIMRLRTTGIRALTELRAGTVRTAAGARLARSLTDAGLAHPRAKQTRAAVTVVVPVRDRIDELTRCLAALGASYPVVVVDDASTESSAIAALCARHRATLIRRESNGGPGAARNSALPHVHTELIAFLDSDCTAPPHWIERLVGHFADPLVAAVAPRIVAPPVTSGSAARYLAARSPLDLGTRAARVMPLGRVSYVPSAALLVRRAALGNRQFDESLRYGEDVDLIWWLHEEGWRVRYDPDVEIEHAEPRSWPGLLRRRYHYGTSAAPLSRRHRDAVSPLNLAPWPTALVAAALLGRPLATAAAYAGAVEVLRRRLRARSLPTEGLASTVAQGSWQTAIGLGRWATQFGAPILLTAVLVPVLPARIRVAGAALLGAPIVHEWFRRRPALGPVQFGLGMLADEMAYGGGVWRGCLRERAFEALVPRWADQSMTTIARPSRVP